ncbi:MAG TPA: ring-cleaving dioxygenase [Gemmatimonadaceae bacterium]|jgi:glyoxalase family protein|nr:ring-cleaving dioxygenase [Gemmatimonadaceae bacterium]
MATIRGLHHVTCIAGDAQENVDFYSGVLGMRLVKKSVNQDSPGTYHLFYADGEGHPGTDITFFPWPEMSPAKPGIGLSMEVSLAIPVGTADYWTERLAEHGVATGAIETRRGSVALPFTDPHGLPLTLHETADDREFTPWRDGPVPVEKQIRGLHSVRLWERDLALTASFLTGVLGFVELGKEGGWWGFGLGDSGSGRYLEIREIADAERGRWGTGGVHHVAWRVPDESTELAVRERIELARRRPTEVIDRFWFKSVYFLEPGGVLFEIATDGPGFAIDEDPATLGEHLVLPPWLESQRAEIEAALPAIKPPTESGARF